MKDKMGFLIVCSVVLTKQNWLCVTLDQQNPPTASSENVFQCNLQL